MPLYPEEVMLIVEGIKKLAAEAIGQTEMDELPKVIVQTEFPPCIDALYNDAAAAHHLPYRSLHPNILHG